MLTMWIHFWGVFKYALYALVSGDFFTFQEILYVACLFRSRNDRWKSVKFGGTNTEPGDCLRLFLPRSSSHEQILKMLECVKSFISYFCSFKKKVYNCHIRLMELWIIFANFSKNSYKSYPSYLNLYSLWWAFLIPKIFVMKNRSPIPLLFSPIV